MFPPPFFFLKVAVLKSSLDTEAAKAAMLLEWTVASLEAEKASAVSAVLRAASQAASAAASKLSQAAMAKVAVQTKRQAAGVEAAAKSGEGEAKKKLVAAAASKVDAAASAGGESVPALAPAAATIAAAAAAAAPVSTPLPTPALARAPTSAPISTSAPTPLPSPVSNPAPIPAPTLALPPDPTLAPPTSKPSPYMWYDVSKEQFAVANMPRGHSLPNKVKTTSGMVRAQETLKASAIDSFAKDLTTKLQIWKEKDDWGVFDPVIAFGTGEATFDLLFSSLLFSSTACLLYLPNMTYDTPPPPIVFSYFQVCGRNVASLCGRRQASLCRLQ